MIKAIETKYKGYNFRSRLEARWAVFFDAMGIEWKYEVEGYEMGSGARYLPDFFVPEFCGSEVYCEIKSKLPVDGSSDGKKIMEFTESIYPDKLCMILCDDPAPGEYVRTHVLFRGMHSVFYIGYIDIPGYEQVCIVPALYYDMKFSPSPSEIIHRLGRWKMPEDVTTEFVLKRNKKIKDAINKFRSARFEHGQSGATP